MEWTKINREQHYHCLKADSREYESNNTPISGPSKRRTTANVPVDIKCPTALTKVGLRAENVELLLSPIEGPAIVWELDDILADETGSAVHGVENSLGEPGVMPKAD